MVVSSSLGLVLVVSERCCRVAELAGAQSSSVRLEMRLNLAIAVKFSKLAFYIRVYHETLTNLIIEDL